jgi:hypothetical protein
MSEFDDIDVPDDEEAALPDDLRALLAEPSMWDEPPAHLESAVITAVTAEVRTVQPAAVAAFASPATARARRRWQGPVLAALASAAAAAVITVAVTNNDDNPTQQADARVDLVGTALEPSISGSIGVHRTESGVALYLKVPGLPRRDGGDYYQVWLKDCDGTYLVPAGSFHDLDDATAWAGVSADDFPIVTVTKEHLAADPAEQASSGDVVATGQLHACS